MQKVDPRKKAAEMEKEILKFWQKNQIFEKSVAKEAPKGQYVFYDGPPFATGTPHYGHIVASAIKDVVPRYWTMRGYRVERKWGWDCHGLPIENIAEKELGVSQKKEIEKMGVEKFNETCRSRVLAYVDEWKKIIPRLGRWADMENSYRTMDKDFMESVWWVFKRLWEEGLVYEDYRSMHICPRCETTLSQSEVAEGYQDIKDLSVTAKFELEDEPGTYVLAWTTTPWTLLGNVALAVGEDIEYVLAEIKVDEKGSLKKDESRSSFKFGEKLTDRLSIGKFKKFIFSREFCERLKDEGCFVSEEKFFKGSELIGKKYQPLFNFYAQDENLENRENGWKIYSGEFVNTDEGTGVVHIAPAFGDDDMQLGKKHNLPFVQHVNLDGSFKKETGEFAGKNVKPRGDHQATDVEIIKYLAKNNLLFSKEKYQHSYPHCWRCDTPLLNYATSSWFVAVTKIKDKILQEAQKISWQPRHIKEGRWGNWLEGARDWSISRQRYWASVIPIWRCDGTTPTGADKDAEGRRKSSCGEMKVVGSISELEKLSGQKVEDLHKHVVDEIVFPCEQCGGTMRRIPDVLDCWFESGSMPYAQAHYPMENKEKFEDGFPAQFIAEGIDQTRAWFYYLHVLATGVMKSIAFENVVVNGIVLAEDGKKMSKRLQNYPDPVLMMEKYGSDSLRYYLMASPVVMAENLNFSEKELSEVSRGLFRMLWNSYSFFTLYATIDEWQPGEAPDQAAQPENLLDRWILSELQLVVKQFNQHMEAYELNKAARLLPGFVDNLSNWYIRRSRRRFWKSEAGDQDKQAAYQTLWQVLTEFSKVVAPFCPFVAEEIYRNLNGFGTGLQTRSRKKGSSSKKGTPESVHLCDFPRAREELIDEELSEKMQLTRQVIEKGLALRAESGIKVRQPLAGCQVLGAGILGSSGQDESGLDQAEFLDLIKDELNVKEVGLVEEEKAGLKWKEEGSLKVGLDTEVTPELALEGQMRELTRQIQEARKKAGFAVEDRIQLFYQGGEQIFKKFSEEIAAEVLAEELKAGDFQADSVDYVADLKIEKEGIRIGLKKS